MSNLKYAIVEEETSTATVEVRVEKGNSRPYLVAKEQPESGLPITRQVEAVLDFEFANGSMPT